MFRQKRGGGGIGRWRVWSDTKGQGMQNEGLQKSQRKRAEVREGGRDGGGGLRGWQSLYECECMEPRVDIVDGLSRIKAPV